MGISGAQVLPQGLAMGDIREQRPDAALDVLGAACTSTGKDNRGSTRHVDWSINSSMTASMPTDHEAHSQTPACESCGESQRLSFGGTAARRPKRNATNQCSRVHDRGKQSRVKPDERCRSPFAIQTFEAEAPATRRSWRRTKVDHTRHGGIHDHAEDTVANRALEMRST